jgi:hypothetical protein
MYPNVTLEEQTIRALTGYEWVRDNHGSLFDRGSSDNYYGRTRDPHYGGVGGGSGGRVDVIDPAAIAEYNAGYDWNEQYGDKKDWG